MTERKTDTSTSEEKGLNTSPIDIDDAEAEGIVAGVSGHQSDRWHQLPDGSGSGFGE